MTTTRNLGRLYGIAAGTAILAIAAGACGGGSGGKPLAKSAYVEKANALCKGVNEKLKALPTPTSTPDAVKLIDEGHKLNSKLVADLRKLGVPSGDKATLDAIFTKIDEALTLIGRMKDAITSGDQAKIDAVSKDLDAMTEDVNGKFEAYGLTECARG